MHYVTKGLRNDASENLYFYSLCKFDLMIQSLLGLKKKFTGRKKIMDEDFEAFTHKNNEKN